VLVKAAYDAAGTGAVKSFDGPADQKTAAAIEWLSRP
jgi:hypothetical protein